MVNKNNFKTDIELYNESDEDIVIIDTNFNDINFNDTNNTDNTNTNNTDNTNNTNTCETQTNYINRDDLTPNEQEIYNNMSDEFLQKNIHLVFQKISKRDEIKRIYINILNYVQNPKSYDSNKYKNGLKILKEDLINDHCSNLSKDDIKELKKIKVKLNYKYGKQDIIDTSKLSNVIEKIIKELILSNHDYNIKILVEKTCFIIFDYINDEYHEVDVLMIILIAEYQFLQNIIYLLLKKSNVNDIKKNKKGIFSNIIKKIFN